VKVKENFYFLNKYISILKEKERERERESETFSIICKILIKVPDSIVKEKERKVLALIF